jgi:2-methylcitrate dehydratase PrpD
VITTHRRGFLRAAALAGSSLELAAAAPQSAETEAARDVTRRLARYVVNARPADVPAPVRKEAARTLLNWVGCAVGGSRHQTLDIAMAALAPFSGRAEATVLGRSTRLDIFQAALMNGISSHVFDFDDTHLKTVIHPAGPVASAILALAEHQPVSGEDFLHALILGVEVECRIGNAVYPAHYDIGWHITGTVGPFGAAAAAGKLLHLSEQQMVWALGIAATQPVGLREMFGTMTKSFHPGRAAQNGLTAALLASKNFTSSDQGIEAPRGWANVLSTSRKYSEITGNLGRTYEIALNSYKPFPCGVVIHPAIDACLQLHQENNIAPEEVERIELSVHPLVLELTGKKTPRTGLEGKFSVYHAVAVAIVRGAVGEKEFSDAAVQDPVIAGLRGRVTATVDRSVAEDQVGLAITLKSGRRLTRHIEHAIGSAKNPLTDAQLEAKFSALVAGVLPTERVRKLMDLAWNIADLADAAELARAAAG